jgi:hypothetical protein
MLKVIVFLYYSCQPFWPLELCQLDNIGRNCGSTSMSGGGGRFVAMKKNIFSILNPRKEDILLS